MKRHGALAQLSRDHHQALVVALHLKRAERGTAARARQEFLDYWRPEGQDHFRQEEDILLPSAVAFCDPEPPIFARVLLDHARIRWLAHTVEAGGEIAIGTLHSLGEQLADHVRREERELFPLMERTLPDDELERLVKLLT